MASSTRFWPGWRRSEAGRVRAVTVVDWYREPLFWLFPVGSLVASVVAFVLFAAPLTWIAWADPVWARPLPAAEPARRASSSWWARRSGGGW